MNPQAATLRLAVFPRSGLLTDVLLVAAGAGLVALAAQIEIPLSVHAGADLGPDLRGAARRRVVGPLLGASSLLLYFFVGLLGAPVYSGGDSGWTIVKGATGGYLVGFIVAAALTGWLAQRQWDRRFNSAVAAMLTGSVVIYLFGLPWLAHVADLDLEGTLEAGLYPFVVGDLLKLYLAGALLPAAWKLVQPPPRVAAFDARAARVGERVSEIARRGPTNGQNQGIDGRPGTCAHRVQPVDAVRGVPDVHGGREGGRPDRRHASPLGRRIGGKEHAWKAEITEQRPDEMRRLEGDRGSREQPVS